MSKVFSAQGKSRAYASLKGETIKACDLPKQNIDPSLKNKITSLKKYCIRNIIHDTIVSSMFLGLIAFLISALCKAEEVNTDAITAIFAAIIFGTVVIIMGKKLLTIPKRIFNYKNYNFERTCYATVSNKYRRATSSKSGRSHIYYVNLQINDNQHIKNVVVSWSKFLNLREGDTVVVTSFDGYKAYVVETNNNSKGNSFSRESFAKNNLSAKDILNSVRNNDFDMENFDIEQFKKDFLQ